MEPQPSSTLGQPTVPNVVLRALVASVAVAVGIFAQDALQGFISGRIGPIQGFSLNMLVFFLLSAILPVAFFFLRRAIPILTLVHDFAGGLWAGATFWVLLTLATASFA